MVGVRMNTNRTTFFKNQIRLYEKKKQTAQYPQYYDNAIQIYKGEIIRELQKKVGTSR